MIATLLWGIPQWGIWMQCGPGRSRQGTVAVGASRGFTMSTAIYAVAGLKCEYGMAKVLENVSSLSGVTDVAMDLITGGQSPLMVKSRTKLVAEAVRGAVENAGFGLLAPTGSEAGDCGDGTSALDRDTHSVREPMMSSVGGVCS
jgi:copper chaperone